MPPAKRRPKVPTKPRHAAPEAIRKRFWSGWAWVVPVVLTAILTYVEWPWFAGAVRRMFS